MAKKTNYTINPGTAHPLGATPDISGVNFSLFSENATAVELLLFSKHNDVKPFKTIQLNPVENRTFYFWHVYVKGIKPGMHYAYRVDGPGEVTNGHRFNRNKVLIDPYAKGNTDSLWIRGDACDDGDNLSTSMRSVVIDTGTYEWNGDEPIRRPMKDSIIYEMHVRGFTQSDTSGVKHPGTFAGVIEKILYLKELGVTAVELLPVFEYDRKEVLRTLEDGTELKNYWGYSTIGFLAPEADFCVSPEEGKHLDEFRDMVKALHGAGIEVILDVVYNHTNEGNHQGPVISFKGFDNSVYYYVVPSAKQFYMDYTGCGNTVNCNHPIVEKFIVDSLKFWANEMHVDGFRFDEGSILTRSMDGGPLQYPPVIWNIELADVFADSKLITEAWDAAGLYQIGGFPGFRWAEWNGKYRDAVRRFVKGDPGVVGDVASRISGSADIYQYARHKPLNSINFIACHDGSTMTDLVSYNYKHNEANGEESRDGSDDNLSWNCGVEGGTDNEDINAFRNNQIKNFATILFLSQGVPMLLMGDEVGRTQNGNNNAYCQDNELSWFDWTALKKNKELFRFFKNMIAFRKMNSSLRRDTFFSGETNDKGLKDIEWHGCALHAPGWNDPESKVLAFTMGSFTKNEPDIHVMLNMSQSDLEFEIPDLIGKQMWHRFIDTSLTSPKDIAAKGEEQSVSDTSYSVKSYSSVVLISK